MEKLYAPIGWVWHKTFLFQFAYVWLGCSLVLPVGLVGLLDLISKDMLGYFLSFSFPIMVLLITRLGLDYYLISFYFFYFLFQCRFGITFSITEYWLCSRYSCVGDAWFPFVIFFFLALQLILHDDWQCILFTFFLLGFVF